MLEEAVEVSMQSLTWWRRLRRGVPNMIEPLVCMSRKYYSIMAVAVEAEAYAVGERRMGGELLEDWWWWRLRWMRWMREEGVIWRHTIVLLRMISLMI